MRFTVQYIPLSKLKPGMAVQMTQRIKALRKMAWDCMYLLIVRKNRKEGSYIIVSGNDHYEYLRKHTKKAYAPCLVEDSSTSKTGARIAELVTRFRKPKLPYDVPRLKREQIPANSWSIIRSFMKEEPRYAKLSKRQQMKVLTLGLRYKKTVIRSMRAKVDELLK